MSPRRGKAIREFVHDQAVLVREGRRHALPFHARHLKAEGDNQRRVDGGREQRLEPRNQLVANLTEVKALYRVDVVSAGQRRERVSR